MDKRGYQTKEDKQGRPETDDERRLRLAEELAALRARTPQTPFPRPKKRVKPTVVKVTRQE